MKVDLFYFNDHKFDLLNSELDLFLQLLLAKSFIICLKLEVIVFVEEYNIRFIINR